MTKNRKILLICLSLFIIFVAVSAMVINNSQPGESWIKRIHLPSFSFLKKSKASADHMYIDSSGFSFKYPKDIKVEDVTPDDTTFYTELELSKNLMNLKISVKDISEDSIDNWIKDSKDYKNAKYVKSISLDGVEAKQYSKLTKLITVSVKDKVLYLIEGPNDNGFWEDTQNIIASTFVFTGNDINVLPISSVSGDINSEVIE
jgi:hypothetical protein